MNYTIPLEFKDVDRRFKEILYKQPMNTLKVG